MHRFVMDELESLRVPPKPITMNGTGVVLNYIKRINAARQVAVPRHVEVQSCVFVVRCNISTMRHDYAVCSIFPTDSLCRKEK
jgi:hypothetical protein